MAFVELANEEVAARVRRELPTKPSKFPNALSTFSFEDFKYLTASETYESLEDKNRPLYVLAVFVSGILRAIPSCGAGSLLVQGFVCV